MTLDKQNNILINNFYKICRFITLFNQLYVKNNEILEIVRQFY